MPRLLLAEAAVLAELEHPNIVPVIDAGRTYHWSAILRHEARRRTTLECVSWEKDNKRLLESSSSTHHNEDPETTQNKATTTLCS